MADPIAVLVEDDPQQSVVSLGVLTTAGFSVRTFTAVSPTLEYLRGTAEVPDLFVLDRRLPMLPGDPETDELGDELLREVRERFPDSRVIVFTGFATVRHVQDSLQGNGQLPGPRESPIDRITVLEKDQSVEFRDHVVEFRGLLQQLEDIEIRLVDPVRAAGESDKRLLRRVAFEYGAASVSATQLVGGMTEASVWRCELMSTQGVLATIVAKGVRKAPTPGGLSELLPAAQTTSRVRTLSGLAGGDFICVLQAAGSAPESLMVVMGSDPSMAVDYVRPLCIALERVPESTEVRTVSQICAPLIDWLELSSALAPFDIEVPPGTLTATVKIGMRHGDLHPANVLINDGSAVLIDFDSNEFAAAALDPITLLLSTLVHPDSPIRGDGWLSVDEIDVAFGSREFGADHSHGPWFEAVAEWVWERSTSPREFWALSLAYVGRQLRYQDVLENPAIMKRALALARKSALSLGDA